MLTTASQEPSPTASEFRGGTERFGFRFAVAVAIFLRPFVEFLFHQRYEIFRMESLLVGTGLLVLCLGVAWATRNRLSLFIVAVCSVSVLQAPFIILLVYPLLDAIPLRYAVVAGIVCNGLLALLMKRHFLAVLLVFCGTSFLFGLAERIIGAPRISESFPSRPVDRPVVEKGVRPARVIHLILDEYMGPAGFPRDTEGSTQARESIVDTFVPRGFMLYENAYSSYMRTVYSVPSSLDCTLNRVGVVDEMPERTQRPYRLLSYWDALGYRFHFYRNAFVPGLEEYLNLPPIKVVEYSHSGIGLAQTIPFSLAERIRLLLGGYAAMNVFARAALSAGWEGTLNVNGTHWTAPVSLEVLDIVERDIIQSDVGSAFVAHLLVPHYAYVYRTDGRTRPLERLLENAQMEGWSASDPAYQQLTMMYSEQVRYLNKKLGDFFDRLREKELFDSSLIIVHGDHGLRMLELGQEDDSFFVYLQN